MRSSCLLTVFLWLFCAASALASPRAILFDLGGAPAFPDDGTSYVGHAGVGFQMDDTWVLHIQAQLQGGDHDLMSGGTVSVLYQLDVTRIIPYFRIGAGISAISGDSTHGLAHGDFGLGVRWLMGRATTIGLEAAVWSPMTDRFGPGVSPRLGLTFGYRLDR